MNFPKLPGYKFNWRSIQIEPIPDSGERFTLGTIVKGEDDALIVAKLVPSTKLKTLFGSAIYSRVSEALGLTISSAEDFYSNNNIINNWVPPIDGFYLGDSRESFASNLEEGLFKAAKHSSILSVAIDNDKQSDKIKHKSDIFNPQTWRKEVLNRIKFSRVELIECFDRDVSLSGSGLPFNFGFISARYAAHFDAISTNKSHRYDSLVRAQSKLWQLDQLRDSNQLFHQEAYELVLYQPDDEDPFVYEFSEELRNEALRREIGLYTSSSVIEAADHVIKAAA